MVSHLSLALTENNISPILVPANSHTNCDRADVAHVAYLLSGHSLKQSMKSTYAICAEVHTCCLFTAIMLVCM